MPGTLTRRILIGASVVFMVAVVGVIVAAAWTGRVGWELLLHACLIGFVIWMVVRAPAPPSGGRCPVCTSRVFPTRRTIDNARVWTCGGCGFEIPRTWVRPRPESQGRPPPPGPQPPGIAP